MISNLLCIQLNKYLHNMLIQLCILMYYLDFNDQQISKIYIYCIILIIRLFNNNKCMFNIQLNINIKFYLYIILLHIDIKY